MLGHNMRYFVLLWGDGYVPFSWPQIIYSSNFCEQNFTLFTPLSSFSGSFLLHKVDAFVFRVIHSFLFSASGMFSRRLSASSHRWKTATLWKKNNAMLFTSDGKKYSKLDGFNQVLHITYTPSPSFTTPFEKVLSPFVKGCQQAESPHLSRMDAMKLHDKDGPYTLVQVYNSKEGFMNHRMSSHFVEFMETVGPLLCDNIAIQEYKSLYPSQDKWIDSISNCKSDYRTLHVSFTVQKESVNDFIHATRQHCQESVEALGGLEGRSDIPRLRMFLVQDTQDDIKFKMAIVVHKDDRSILTELKNSESYETWSDYMDNLLQSPRSSIRYENI